MLYLSHFSLFLGQYQKQVQSFWSIIYSYAFIDIVLHCSVLKIIYF